MSDESNIEWCDSTFNPWIGCTKVGLGCDHCYAEADFDLRKHRAKWGPGNPRSRTSPANWKKPLQWNAKPFYECGCGYRGTLDELTTNAVHGCGLKFKRTRRRVFCASLADVFDNDVPVEWRADLFALIADTPHLDWLLLTKRIGNAMRMISTAIDRDYMPVWPWHNVWLGATICNQAEGDRDIPKLLAVPAAVRWLSMEPLLGPVDLAKYLPCAHRRDGPKHRPFGCEHDLVFGGCHKVGWVVVGGESGANARPMHPEWARSLRDQCAVAGIPFLLKQWGEWIEYECGTDTFKGNEITLTNMGEAWPRSVNCYGGRVEGRVHMRCVGKKAAGRLLDGVLHDTYPGARP